MPLHIANINTAQSQKHMDHIYIYVYSLQQHFPNATATTPGSQCVWQREQVELTPPFTKEVERSWTVVWRSSDTLLFSFKAFLNNNLRFFVVTSDNVKAELAGSSRWLFLLGCVRACVALPTNSLMFLKAPRRARPCKAGLWSGDTEAGVQRASLFP